MLKLFSFHDKIKDLDDIFLMNVQKENIIFSIE
jgi:hypothetical protein